MKPDISVFLLAYNEEDNIREAVESSLSVLRDVAGEYEVLVVLYEGSTDNTRSIVEEMMGKNARIRLVMQARDNPGYGAAMRLGYENSQFSLVFYTDADNQFDVAELKNMLPLIEEAELVIGYRVGRKDPFGRIVAARVYNLLVWLIFGLRVRDVDCAFKLVRAEIFDRISLDYDTGISDAELLVKAKRSGYRIAEVPVSHRLRKAGKAVFHEGGFGLVKPSVVLNLLKDILKLKKELR